MGSRRVISLSLPPFSLAIIRDSRNILYRDFLRATLYVSYKTDGARNPFTQIPRAERGGFRSVTLLQTRDCFIRFDTPTCERVIRDEYITENIY